MVRVQYPYVSYFVRLTLHVKPYCRKILSEVAGGGFFGFDKLSASFFFGVRSWLGTILGRFSIIYFRGLGLRVSVSVMLWSG